MGGQPLHLRLSADVDSKAPFNALQWVPADSLRSRTRVALRAEVLPLIARVSDSCAQQL